MICKYGDPFCPCQDGDLCHYEGENPMSTDYKSMQKRMEAQGATTAETLLEVIKAKDRFITALQSMLDAKNAEIDRLKGRITELDKAISQLRRPLGERYVPLMKYRDKL